MMNGIQAGVTLTFITAIIAIFAIPIILDIRESRRRRRWRRGYRRSRFERKQIRFFRREYFNALRKARYYDNSLFRSLADAQRKRAENALEKLKELRGI
jgi:hypothetical protein